MVHAYIAFVTSCPRLWNKEESECIDGLHIIRGMGWEDIFRVFVHCFLLVRCIVLSYTRVAEKGLSNLQKYGKRISIQP
ncbi:hypothetical protein CEXT_597491 [Caerostris extrusa]|uniref:Uncharacterized protein n=1 Tax=Caerostris extrusa TaxID=172846 RepID=A0AAV4WH04_CAEEX|nr:hypothetical protein CEXT_597491 [Caerostris extrusa]